MQRAILMIFVGAMVCSSALAQAAKTVPAGKTGEVVMSANGAPSAAWVERKICDEDKCRTLVINRTTREIARVDGRLTSAFKVTGSGKEIVRAYDKRTPEKPVVRN